MKISGLVIPSHHQLNKGIAPEDAKDLDHVSEFIHARRAAEYAAKKAEKYKPMDSDGNGNGISRRSRVMMRQSQH